MLTFVKADQLVIRCKFNTKRLNACMDALRHNLATPVYTVGRFVVSNHHVARAAQLLKLDVPVIAVEDTIM